MELKFPASLLRSSPNASRGASIVCALALSACAIFFAHARAAAQVSARNDAAVSTETPEGRLLIFDEVWENVARRYYDPSMRGVDWQAMRRTFRPQAEEAEGQAEFYAVLRRMLGHLHDPHTRVFAPGESTDWRVPRFVAVGVGVREIAGETVVTSVDRDSEAAHAGVRAGDTVLSIDGEPVSTILARRLREQDSGTSMTARLLAVARIFDGPRDSFISVVFRRQDASEKNVRLRRVLHARQPALNVRRAGGGVGVVQFNIFTPELAVQFVRALKDELREARALVIDLRENGGGEAESMADIASVFLSAGTSLGRFTDRRGEPQLEPYTRAVLLSTAEALPRFRGPIVVLTGVRTASASEVFIAALKEHARARVVGESTCGCVLGIQRRHPLPDGGVLDISEMDYHTASGLRLEGAGIRPDDPITPTRRDLRNGRDPALERAIEILKIQLGK